MRLFLTAAAASLAIAVAGCDNRADDAADTNLADTAAMNDMAMDGANEMNMAGTDMAPMTAAAFVAAAAATDMYEIESGKLAQSMATMEECKKLGSKLVADHTKSSADLKAAAAAASVTVPAAMPAEQQAMIDALKAAKGPAFDKLFLEQQKEAHRKALATLNSYAAGGDVPSLKEFAGKTAPVVKRHLDMLESMKI